MPSTWKISEPTHENLARTILLHEDVADIKTLAYQFLQDEKQLISELYPLPGANMERHLVFTDITHMRLLSGMIFRIGMPIATSVLPVITRILTDYTKT